MLSNLKNLFTMSGMDQENSGPLVNSASFFIDTLINVAVAIFIFSIVYFFIAQPHQVDGGSMLPNFHNGDYLLTEKLTQRFSEIKRGDVIVFHYPKLTTRDYIKRVVALPGEKIRIMNGLVIIDDVPLDEVAYIPANTFTRGHAFLKDDEEYAVGANEYIVMGDNRNESSDSREWGTVPASLIVGKVFFRYWPLDRIGLVHNQ